MLEPKGMFIAVIAFLFLLIGIYRKKIILYTKVGPSKIIFFDFFYDMSFVLFWLFAVCTTDSADLSNYRWAYEQRLSHGKEPLFDVVQFFFKDIGCSFDFFKLVWISVVVVLLYTGIKKYSKFPSAVFGLALVTMLTGFVTQMRSALVGAIFLNAFSLVLSERKKDRVLYAIIILLSAQIHILAYAFLIFLFVKPNKNMVFKKAYYIIIAIVTFSTLFLSRLPFINSIQTMLSFEGMSVTRTMSYLQGGDSQFRYAFFLIVKHLFVFFLTNYACKIQLEIVDKNDKENKNQKNARIIQEANTLMLVFLPITIQAASFERLFNYFILIQYATVFNEGKSKIIISDSKKMKLSLQSILVIGMLFITFIELYFSPSDMIRILNSVKWIF